MGVCPVAKRTANLDVAELAAGNDVAMLGDPEQAKRAHAERDSRAILNSAGAGNDAEALAGRRETLEGTRPRVPAVEGFGGNGNARLRCIVSIRDSPA